TAAPAPASRSSRAPSGGGRPSTSRSSSGLLPAEGDDLVDQDRHHQRQQHHHDRGGLPGLLLGEQLAEEQVGDHVGGVQAVGGHVDDVEDLQHQDQHRDQHG